jgi:hypothetical protein
MGATAGKATTPRMIPGFDGLTSGRPTSDPLHDTDPNPYL